MLSPPGSGAWEGGLAGAEDCKIPGKVLVEGCAPGNLAPFMGLGPKYGQTRCISFGWGRGGVGWLVWGKCLLTWHSLWQ